MSEDSPIAVCGVYGACVYPYMYSPIIFPYVWIHSQGYTHTTHPTHTTPAGTHKYPAISSRAWHFFGAISGYLVVVRTPGGEGGWVHIYSVGVFRAIYIYIHPHRTPIAPIARVFPRFPQCQSQVTGHRSSSFGGWALNLARAFGAGAGSPAGASVRLVALTGGCPTTARATGWRQTRDVCVCVCESERARGGGGRCEDDAHVGDDDDDTRRRHTTTPPWRTDEGMGRRMAHDRRRRIRRT